jgi:hypothetical protein
MDETDQHGPGNEEKNTEDLTRKAFSWKTMKTVVG